MFQWWCTARKSSSHCPAQQRKGWPHRNPRADRASALRSPSRCWLSAGWPQYTRVERCTCWCSQWRSWRRFRWWRHLAPSVRAVCGRCLYVELNQQNKINKRGIVLLLWMLQHTLFFIFFIFSSFFLLFFKRLAVSFVSDVLWMP